MKTKRMQGLKLIVCYAKYYFVFTTILNIRAFKKFNMEILVKIESGHKPKNTNILPKTLADRIPNPIPK